VGCARDGGLVPIVQGFVGSVLCALANGRRLAEDLAALEAEWSGRGAGRRRHARVGGVASEASRAMRRPARYR